MRDAALRVDAAERALEVRPRDAAWQDVKSWLARAEQSLVQAERICLLHSSCGSCRAEACRAGTGKITGGSHGSRTRRVSARLPELIELGCRERNTENRAAFAAPRSVPSISWGNRSDAMRSGCVLCARKCAGWTSNTVPGFRNCKAGATNGRPHGRKKSSWKS